MDILSHSSSSLTLPLHRGGRVALVFVGLSLGLYPSILPFYHPIPSYHTNTLTLNTQGFIANDPLALNELDDWRGEYHPRNGENIALRSLRLDMGVRIEGYYFGYFYQDEYVARGSRGFVDFYHAIKNDTKVATQKDYEMDFEIEGITQEGLIVSKSTTLWDTTHGKLTLGVGGYLSYATQIQSGRLWGKASIATDDTYSGALEAE